jgi:DNA ligase-1
MDATTTVIGQLPRALAEAPLAERAAAATLLHVAATGRGKQWAVRVEGAVDAAVVRIVTEFGQVGGKLQTQVREVREGKNAGKANATTPYTQAVAEATARWREKVEKEGYAPRFEAAAAANAGAGDAAAPAAPAAPRGPLLPMLAHDYHKRAKSLAWPCFAQAKLDGVRCLATVGADGAVALTSRTGKPFPHVAHVKAAVAAAAAAVAAAGRPMLQLDGEIYSDTLTFQELVGAVKRVTLGADDAAAQAALHLTVYDAVLPAPFSERLAALRAFFEAHGAALAPAVRLLDTVPCADAARATALHDAYVAQGYEGVILRNAAGPYRLGVRSADLQKLKAFEDAEYVVVGHAVGEGVEAGAVVWECVADTPSGPRRFSVRPRGSHEERRALAAKAAEYVGRRLTVRYQELTDDGVPRFPVGVAFREYE